MKIFITLVLFTYFFNGYALDKDFVLDPKTSTLIPKYMALVKVVKGVVKVEDRELVKGSKIYVNDTIITPANSFIVLDLTDATTITLGPNSEFKAEKWIYRTKNDREAVFSVIKGQWRALVRSKSKTEDQLKIKTPNASMGIRGTELLVNFQAPEAKEITQVALLEGSVHIDGETPEKAKDLKPGDHIILVKTASGMEQKTSVLSTEEKKLLNGFMAPDVPQLLEQVAFNDVKSENLSPSASVQLSDSNHVQNVKQEESPKSWKQNLQKLNQVRNDNRKK